MVLASLTMRRVFWVSKASEQTSSFLFWNWDSFFIRLPNRPPIWLPDFAMTSNHDTWASREMDKSNITSIINRLPDLPNSQAMPEPANKPTKPPAPTGRDSLNASSNRKCSIIGLHTSRRNNAKAATPWLYGLWFSCFFMGRKFL